MFSNLNHHAQHSLYDPDDLKGVAKERHCWTSKSEFEFLLVGLVLQSFIKNYAEQQHMLRGEKPNEFAYALKQSAAINTLQVTSFIYQGQLFTYDCTTDFNSATHSIQSPRDLQWFVEEIEDILQNKNPVIGSYLRVTADSGELAVSVAAPPQVLNTEVVLPLGVTTDELFLETVGALKVGEDNGIILHGPPGTGKSHTLKHLAGMALAEGFSVVEVSSSIPYQQLGALLRFLGSTLILLEDIDTNAGGEDRRHTSGGNLSPLFQLLSGITHGPNPIVTVATTNHLDHLDEGFRLRPDRFNRILEMGYPDAVAINRLIELYLKKGDLSNEQLDACRNLEVPASFFRALGARMEILIRNNGLTPREAFDVEFPRLSKQFSRRAEMAGFLPSGSNRN